MNNRAIIEYMVVVERKKDDIEKSVNKALTLGWQPQNALIIHQPPQGMIMYIQVMVKYG